MKRFDIFGHAITLNFNRRGNTYNTGLGGFLSIVLHGVFLYLIYVKSLDVINRKQLNVSMGTQITDIEETGEIIMEQYNFLPFLRIRTFNSKEIGNYKGFD